MDKKRALNGLFGRALCLVGLLTVLGDLRADTDHSTKAIAQRTIDAPFALDENALRRLVDVINARAAQEFASPSVRFEVTHADNTGYETSDLEFVLHDVNPPYNPIVALHIEVREATLENIVVARLPSNARRDEIERAIKAAIPESSAKIDVVFNQDGSQFEVRAPGVDWVFATRTDLLNQLQAANDSNLGLPKIRGAVGLFVFVCLSLFAASIFRNRFDKRRLPIRALNAPPTPIFQYIHSVRDPFWARPQRKVFGFFLLLSFGAAAVGTTCLYRQAVAFLFPRATFAIGGMLSVYQHLLDLRSKILWVIIGGILLRGVFALMRFLVEFSGRRTLRNR